MDMHICISAKLLGKCLTMLRQIMRHSLRVGLLSHFLISSARIRIIWRRLSGAGRLLLAIADWTSTGILSQGISKFSYHLLDMLGDWLSLLKVQGVDAREELELKLEDVQGCGLESEDILVSVDSSGNFWRSSVTCVVSETHKIEIQFFKANPISHQDVG